MSNWNYPEYINQIKNAKTPEELAGLQFDSPGPIDRRRGASDRNVLELMQMQDERKGQLQGQAAIPAIQQMTDWKNQGNSSDPNFTGKEWTDGMFSLDAANNGKPLPDMNNPSVSAAVNGFAGGAQREKSYADQLQRTGESVQDAGSLSRMALDPGMLPHLSALEKAPTAFAAPVEDTTTPANRAFMEGLPAVFSAAVSDQPGILSKLLHTTGADPKFAADQLKQVQSQNVADKTTGMPAPHPMHFGNGTIQDMRFNPTTGKDEPYGERYKPTAQQRIEMPKIPAPGRLYPAIDTANGNRISYVDAATVKAANETEPGRYVPASQGAKALGQTALQEDIKGSIVSLRSSITNLKSDFTPKQRAQLSLIMKDRDPKSAISNFMGSSWAGTLAPDQQDYIIANLQLKEQAMAMRSLLGSGAGSDKQREAIFATIPGMGTPSKAFANKQLDQFEAAVNRISRGTPSVPLRKDVVKSSGKVGKYSYTVN